MRQQDRVLIAVVPCAVQSPRLFYSVTVRYVEPEQYWSCTVISGVESVQDPGSISVHD